MAIYCDFQGKYEVCMAVDSMLNTFGILQLIQNDEQRNYCEDQVKISENPETGN